jgi:hypothetical protein
MFLANFLVFLVESYLDEEEGIHTRYPRIYSLNLSGFGGRLPFYFVLYPSNSASLDPSVLAELQLFNYYDY